MRRKSLAKYKHLHTCSNSVVDLSAVWFDVSFGIVFAICVYYIYHFWLRYVVEWSSFRKELLIRLTISAFCSMSW